MAAANIILRTIHSHVNPGRVVLNPSTAGDAYIRVVIFYQHIKYHILNMLKMNYDINQQDLKRVNLHFVKSE